MCVLWKRGGNEANVHTDLTVVQPSRSVPQSLHHAYLLISPCSDYLHVEAVADYQPEETNRDKLKLKTGDVVRVYRVTDGQWWTNIFHKYT